MSKDRCSEPRLLHRSDSIGEIYADNHEWRVADHAQYRDRADITFYCIYCKQVEIVKRGNYG
jgi:hypothetical protein